MITGAHTIIYSKKPEADKAFFKNVLKFTNIDIGHDWLIFRLPPSELAIHPASENNLQEFYLMCDDIDTFIKEMAANKIKSSAVQNERWGSLTYITLPGGGKLGVYEPKHASPPPYKKTSKARK
jgi:hypothetical protein